MTKQFFDIQQNTDIDWQMAQFHFHDSYEIILVLEGDGEMRIGSHSYSLTRGTIVLLASGEIHRSQGKGIYQRYVCKFPAEYIAQLSTTQTDLRKMFTSEIPCIQLSEKELVPLLLPLEKAVVKTAEYGNDLLRQNAFIEWMVALNHLAGISQRAASLHSKHAERITPIMEYIAEHAKEELTLDMVAGEFFITKQHLCYIFKKSTGLGINEYLTAQRLILACGYLRQGIGVQLAGEQAGFRNNSHFIRTFKKAFGVSPGKYLAGYRDTLFV